MRVLFVFPDLSPNLTDYSGVISLGIASLSASLRDAGHEPSLYHIVAAPSEAVFRETVRAARPDLVAFSSNSHYARRLPDWTSWAGAETGAPVVVGGVHATLAPENVSALSHVGFTCVGEGEEALVELCDALESGRDPSGIANLWVRSGSSVTRNRMRPLHDLAALPLPDYALFDFQGLYTVRRGEFPFIMSRGCGFACTYCCSHALRSATAGAGRYWRHMSPRAAALRLRALIDAHRPDVPTVTFLDTILYPDAEWLAEFAPAYRELVGLPFSCNLRADFVDRVTARLLREMGCRTVRLGLESGDEEMTAKVLKRGLKVERIEEAFRLLADEGIARWSYNMVGLPGETLRRALKTIRVNAEVEPEEVIYFIFYPYPGTKLRELCAAEGLLTDREYDNYRVGVTLHSALFKELDVLFVHYFHGGLIRLYALAKRLPRRSRSTWYALVDAILTSPLVPRGLLARSRRAYGSLRHEWGNHLARRSSRLYRLFGGTAPSRPAGCSPQMPPNRPPSSRFVRTP